VLKIALVALTGGPAATAQPATADHRTPDRGVSGLAAAMTADGHQVTIYARRDSARQPAVTTLDSGVTIRRLPAGTPGRTPGDLGQQVRQFADGLADRWRADRPDVAHAYFWTSGLAALAGARDQDVPVVQTFASLGAAEHRHHLPALGPAGRIRLEASIGRAVSAVLAGSSEETTDLAGLGVPSSSVRIVPCGVDTERFTPDGPTARRSRKPRVLAFGPLEPRQGLDTLIRAMAQVPGAELVIVGGPHRRELRAEAYYRTLAGLAARAGLRDRVTFTGRVPADDLPGWYRSADLFVSAATYEPFGRATLRAMACGVPVIATSVGANSDAVIDGTTGLLVPPDRPKLLGQHIRELLAAPVRRGALGIAGADRARSRYSWERIGQETVRAYPGATARATAA
jgi:D-inositol-3-phosphate glycosyltransferase